METPSSIARVWRNKISDFVAIRLADKLDKLDKLAEDDPKRDALLAQYQPAAWLEEDRKSVV